MSYTITLTPARLKPDETEVSQRVAEPVVQRSVLTPAESHRKSYTEAKPPSKKKASRQSPVSVIRAALDNARTAFERLDTREAAQVDDATLDDLFEAWDALRVQANRVFRLL